MKRNLLSITILVLIAILVFIGTYKTIIDRKKDNNPEQISEYKDENGNSIPAMKIERIVITDEDEKKEEETKNIKPKTNSGKIKVVSQKYIAEERTKDFKYGIKQIETKYYRVLTLENEDVVKDLIKTDYTYDAREYVANIEGLKEEAQKILKDNKKLIEEVEKYVNEYRKEKDLSNIKLNDNLSLAATVKAIEMGYTARNKIFITYQRPNNIPNSTILNELNVSYDIFNENIYAGNKKIMDIIGEWKEKKVESENMLNTDYKKAGVGIFKFNDTTYLVLMFTN